ncbi:hypothetical protein GO988_21650 [Hymenobacter sp. HMF4947]|uniref:Uncharacterized protein n=1 Tax=Hymenobacter ginkgonis TaxID=2682976 RepID=A0A7K1TKP5_9BACT|nr:hypothetical protein [Hymenobacter ginkgonis]MVN78943.1 hypothetical protein [Hymenobacter ginkgonis]
MDKPLLPPLASALKGEKPLSLTDGFREGDLLHLKAEVAGRPKGTVLPVLGYCLCFDAQGQPYALRAYVPICPAYATTYAGREAARFPEPGQRERWLGGVQMRFTEIDLTDHAHELAVERRREALVVQMYPDRQQDRLAA